MQPFHVATSILCTHIDLCLFGCVQPTQLYASSQHHACYSSSVAHKLIHVEHHTSASGLRHWDLRCSNIMEHTEWEAQTQPRASSPLSPGQSQPVKARTKYSFTGYHYLTDASMHGAALSPLRQLYKLGQGQSPKQAPGHDGMQRHSPGQGTAQTQEQSSLNHDGQSRGDDTHASNYAPGSDHYENCGHADGGQQSYEEHDVSQQEQRGRHTQTDAHGQRHNAAACDNVKHQQGTQQLLQQPQKQHHRFKIIDFGHADLEPVQGHMAPGLVKTK